MKKKEFFELQEKGMAYIYGQPSGNNYFIVNNVADSLSNPHYVAYQENEAGKMSLIMEVDDLESLKEAIKQYDKIRAKTEKTAIEIARRELNWSAATFAKEFGIPLRTVESWEAKKRKCPEYTERLILEKLERIKKEQNK